MRTNDLIVEKARLEASLKQKEQEIETLKQLVGKESVQVKEIIAVREKEYEDIKMQLETLEMKLESEKEKVSHLQVEKELQKTLDQRGKEIQFLKKSFQEKEKYLKEIITSREQEVLEHKQQLKKVKEELQAKKKETTHLQECVHKVMVELEWKKVLARQLQEAKDEICSQLKEERKRMDENMMQLITAQVIKACFHYKVL